MAVELTKRLLSTEAYHLMIEAGILTEDDKVELLNGEIIDMSPIGDLHSGTVNWLSNYLSQILAGKAVISTQNPVVLGDHSEPEPDIVVCRFEPDFYRKGKPTAKDVHLIIEVSDSTLAKDRELKLPIYAENGVPEYWIINLQDSQVEIHSQPEGKIYRKREIKIPGDRLSIPGFEYDLDVGEIFG